MHPKPMLFDKAPAVGVADGKAIAILTQKRSTLWYEDHHISVRKPCVLIDFDHCVFARSEYAKTLCL